MDSLQPSDSPQSSHTTPSIARARLQRVRNVTDSLESRTARRAIIEALILLPLLVAVPYVNTHPPAGLSNYPDALRFVSVGIMILAGWAFARDIGRGARPILFRRMAPEASGPADFILRAATLVIILTVALNVAGVHFSSLGTTGTLGVVMIGLAAQQSLGNVFAGFVLLGVHPYHIGDSVRLQGGGMAGSVEGRVAAMGLFYTRLTRGEDSVHVPNAAVLNAAITPLREPDSVDLVATLAPGVRPTDVQAALSDLSIPTRRRPRVDVESVDQERLVVRISATPRRAEDDVKLADEVLETISEME